MVRCDGTSETLQLSLHPSSDGLVQGLQCYIATTDFVVNITLTDKTDIEGQVLLEGLFNGPHLINSLVPRVQQIKIRSS